jgi:hypothetical protein
MKRLFYLTLIFYFTLLLKVAAYEGVNVNIMCRVYELAYGQDQGTGFTVEVDGRQYIVTAKHLFPGTNQLAEVAIRHDKQWETMTVNILRSTDADVAVLVPPLVLTTTHYPIKYGMEGAIFGQEVYFLGFPYGMYTDIPNEMNNGFPMPFIKRGTLSAMSQEPGGHMVIFVDGINNPGFSGGPLVAIDDSTKQMKVLGVVVGYKANADIVFTNNIDSGWRSAGNSGIIVCYDIKYAFDEIKKQHGGPKLPQ